ncbi:MAG: hypothetical protein Q9M82_01970, partial [Mariprofundus sp.]|nr:hypothetical protein [Mariprofundus sp.]
MLEEKIRQAGQAQVQSSKRMLMMFAAAVCFIAVVIVAILFFDFSSPSPAPEIAVAVTTPPPEDVLKLREQFKQELRAYEADIVPALADAHLKVWNANAELEINTLRDSATASFATGDYIAALKSLAGLESIAKQVLAQREEMFSSAFSMAESALAADNHIEAKQHISKALLL